MLQSVFSRYINNFRGFSREIWILATITFINRAGTMVIPFLSKYLREDLRLDYGQISWVIACFGLGSMVGSWLGGKFSDKIGFYKVMVFSLFCTGLLFFAVQFVTTFHGLCAAFFGIMVIADMFRPAMFVSLSAYAKPENRTRALTLVRLAVNLGFAAGPALGGLIIMGMGYKGLFWADGASCIVAILVFATLVKEIKKPAQTHAIEQAAQVKSVFNDRIFGIFLFVSLVTAMVFFQLFTTLPLYHHERYGLTELQTGLLMTLNGLLVFALEMPIVGYFERMKTSRIKLVFVGALLMSLGFLVLLFDGWVYALVFNIIFLTFGEIFAFPFSNAFVLSRAPRGYEGRYMGLYTMSFSLAHIAGAKVGMAVIAGPGYAMNWLTMAILALFAGGCLIYVLKLSKQQVL